MQATSDFDRAVNEALAQRMLGWDFSWLNERSKVEQLPWDYGAVVRERMRGVASLLDLGTGGGEFLSSLAPLPPNTQATEGYPPNVVMARKRLEPLGVFVADVSEMHDHLPFSDSSFDLVIDRHEGFDSHEVFRVLKPGGRFVTQQVGGENMLDLNRFLQDNPYYTYGDYNLNDQVMQLKRAGFNIITAREAFPLFSFLDIAGVVFYLTVVPWQIEDFSVEHYRDRLIELHQLILREGAFKVKEHRIFVEAEKPVS